MYYSDFVSKGQYVINGELYHHGIKGQKWGVRRYQNLDGSLTAEGKLRYTKAVKMTGYIEGNVNGSSMNAPVDMVNDAKKVNGGYNTAKYGYNRHSNCAFCSATYDARRRGVNVQAQQSLHGIYSGEKGGYYKDLYSDYERSMTKKTCRRSSSDKNMNLGMTSKEFDEFTKDILSEGPNSRGAILLDWKSNIPNGFPLGGHAINYEVKNGKFYLVDPQVGEVLNSKAAKKYLSNAINIERTRTDNLSLNTDVLMTKYAEKPTDSTMNINTAKKMSKKLSVASMSAALIGLGGTAVGAMTSSPEIAAAGLGSIMASRALRIGAAVASDKGYINDINEYNKLLEKWKNEGRDDTWYIFEGKNGRELR